MRLLQHLFGPRRPTLTSLTCNVQSLGWLQHDEGSHHRTWLHPSLPAQLSLHFFALPPDLPSGLAPGRLRQHFRQVLQAQGGGLLEVTPEQLGPVPLVRTLFKFPQEPSGLSYLGALTLPFRHCSYVLKVQAYETGLTGMREAIIAEQRMQTGQLQLTDTGPIGWFADPYDPYITTGLLMSHAELPQYDEQWPGHPLTIVRQQLQALPATLHLSPELLQAPAFV